MRRRITALILLPIVLLLSGCMRMTTDIEIKSNETAGISIDIGIEKKVAKTAKSSGYINETSMCDSKVFKSSFPKDKNITLKSYDEGDFIGCRISGDVPISEVSNKNISLKHEGNIWIFKFDGSSATNSFNGKSASQVFSDFSFSIKFPGKVLTHSGSSKVSGTTVTWNNADEAFSSEGLTATAEDTASAASVASSYLPKIVLGALIGAAIIGGVLWFLKNHKKNAAAAQQMQGFPQSGQTQYMPQGQAQGFQQQPVQPTYLPQGQPQEFPQQPGQPVVNSPQQPPLPQPGQNPQYPGQPQS
ncbi:MAG: LppM family (lipo)protein [Propionibacteriaceae bacterium]